MFNPNRLVLARKRRGLTGEALAKAIKVSPVTISRLENGETEPLPETLEAIAGRLEFPRGFFSGPNIDELPKEAASFRSLTTMTAKERDAALASGSLSYLLSDWVSERFNLPSPNLIDLGHERDFSKAAFSLRQYWGLGEQPISNMIKLLESKGIRVFSLSENTKNVDAFSCWRGDVPYIFLNTFKSTERSRFDAAHELAHLVLHRHGGPDQRLAEQQANNFASSFLMPEADVRSRASYVTSIEQLIHKKKRWGVSVAALIYRLRKLNLLNEYQYRSFYIQINKLGYMKYEPEQAPPEESVVWKKVFTDLWADRITKNHVANELHIPFNEIENLVFGLNINLKNKLANKDKSKIQLVQ